MAVLGLRFCARAFSSCGKRGPLFIAVRGPLTITASLVAEHRVQTRRLSNCGSRAQLLHGTWDLPRPGLEPVSPALAGRFSTTVPPGKPTHSEFEAEPGPTPGPGDCQSWALTLISQRELARRERSSPPSTMCPMDVINHLRTLLVEFSTNSCSLTTYISPGSFPLFSLLLTLKKMALPALLSHQGLT